MTDAHLNPLMTLGAIRAEGPRQPGWESLLRGLGYANGRHDPERRVSLGDIAKTNDAADALWCVRALEWRDIAVRRRVVSAAVMPAVRRASVHTIDQRVHDCIAALDRWCAGDDDVDLALAATEAARAAAARAAAWAAAEAAWAAEAEWAAADAAADDEATERALQRADIIAAFPPVALKETAND